MNDFCSARDFPNLNQFSLKCQILILSQVLVLNRASSPVAEVRASSRIGERIIALLARRNCPTMIFFFLTFIQWLAVDCDKSVSPGENRNEGLKVKVVVLLLR